MSLSMDSVHRAVNTARDDYVDNTHWIRHARNAKLYRSDVNTIVATVARRVLEKSGGDAENLVSLTEADMDAAFTECKETAKFLFDEMPAVFARLLTNRLKVPIFFQLLDVLESIERGERDQCEGSEFVGRLLHSSFVGGTDPVDPVDPAPDSSSSSSSKLPTLTWAEHRSTRDLSVINTLQLSQNTKDESKAKLRAAIEKKRHGKK